MEPPLNVFRLFRGLFFRERSDYQKILSRYSRALAQPMTDLNRFSRLAPYLLVKSMNICGASVMVLDRDSHNYVVRAGEGEAAIIEKYEVAEDSLLLAELLRGGELEIKEVRRLTRGDGPAASKYKEILAEMERLKAVLIIPSITEGEYFKKPTLLAAINLGEKLSGQDYSTEDIDFLKTMANQATLGIEYSFIFEELTKHQKRVVEAEKLAAIGTTAAGVAHELKNPLTYISAVAQVLSKKWDDPQFKASVSQMLPAEVKRMQLIVEGLLDYSRNRPLNLVSLDIKEVLEKALAVLAYEIKKSAVDVTVEYHHSAAACGDQNRLMQVFVNLIANAIQAMGSAGGTLSIKTSNVDKGILVSLIDSGPGIAQNKLDQIFEPFFTTKDYGTGLGLSISKKIIEEHHGSISVVSAPGQGARFSVFLPARAP